MRLSLSLIPYEILLEPKTLSTLKQLWNFLILYFNYVIKYIY